MKVFNRRARRDYQLLEKIEAGISLLGPEVKSVLQGRISLEESFVRIKNGQAYLFNAHIYPYHFADTKNLDPTRTRRLLLHKKELLALETKTKQKRLTIVPLSCYTTSTKRGVPGSYTKRGLVKLEIALARGKREYEHREEVKRKDLRREAEIELKTRGWIVSTEIALLKQQANFDQKLSNKVKKINGNRNFAVNYAIA